MKKLNKTIALLLTLTFAASVTGCSGNNDSSSNKTDTSKTEQSVSDTLEKLVVGATSTPHGEILEQVKDDLVEQGYELEIVI
ncbi:MAG: metal ABC transporter substrate-binding protein, partial [Oscillospiraceae bacterium]|nr:metal ABC transporter substrate-binding protein [Oscillospiraceae bacterium]